MRDTYHAEPLSVDSVAQAVVQATFKKGKASTPFCKRAIFSLLILFQGTFDPEAILELSKEAH